MHSHHLPVPFFVVRPILWSIDFGFLFWNDHMHKCIMLPPYIWRWSEEKIGMGDALRDRSDPRGSELPKRNRGCGRVCPDYVPALRANRAFNGPRSPRICKTNNEIKQPLWSIAHWTFHNIVLTFSWAHDSRADLEHRAGVKIECIFFRVHSADFMYLDHFFAFWCNIFVGTT